MSGLLTEVLCDSRRAADLDPHSWNRLLAEARRTRLLGRLAWILADAGVQRSIPAAAAECLDWAREHAAAQERTIRSEVRRIERALEALDVPVVLLKGAAYVMAGLPAARGRLFTDVDILVPKAALGRVERSLRSHGWNPGDLDPYDQRYYREWMHELPPLIHSDRGSTLDVHHTILPESGRLHPNTPELFARAVPVAGRRLFVLEPADMVLHAAAHLFQDGEVAGGLRDLVDLDNLLRLFGSEAGFWGRLQERARLHELARPLCYAVRYAQRFLRTPAPRLNLPNPPTVLLALMDRLVALAMFPRDALEPSGAARFSAFALYVRSHWLRMPAGLLLRHLSRKAWRRWAVPDQLRT